LQPYFIHLGSDISLNSCFHIVSVSSVEMFSVYFVFLTIQKAGKIIALYWVAEKNGILKKT
jgi:hypothetical protein